MPRDADSSKASIFKQVCFLVSRAAGAHGSTVHVRTLVACAVFVWHRTSPFVFSRFLERVGGEPVLKGQNDTGPPLTSFSHHLIGSTLRPWWAHDSGKRCGLEARCHILCTPAFPPPRSASALCAHLAAQK